MEILKKPIVKDIITNVVYLLLIVMYFICFNTQASLLDSTKILNFINISSLVFLGISIIMFEIGYKKDNVKFFFNGIELFILSISTLLIKHIPKVTGNTMNNYTESIIYGFITYYILKSAILYTKMKQEQLNNLSDIKEIVKDEPTKKATKRKNKKEEGK